MSSTAGSGEAAPSGGIAQGTLADYESKAQSFWTGTRDHDVSQNIDALLGAIEADAPWTLLDFGCGPGRDLKTLREHGHCPIGLDGAASFVRMAREFSGCEVWQQDFLALNLPEAHFDGIFANATLQHIPGSDLPRVLGELFAALKPGGVLFASIPHGDDREGWNNGRYSRYHRPASWQRLLAEAGFTELRHYFRPDGQPREQQPWFAGAWRR